MRRASPRGFTVVELLVVITIIVVLLALLMPAMDQAVYQAELAVCASHLSVMADGLILYTYGNKKHYPNRPSHVANGSNRPIDVFYRKDSLVLRPERDDRLILKQCFSLNKTLNCPLTKWIDIEGSDSDTTIVSPYGLYFGFQYKIANQPEKFMNRLGDRLTWKGGRYNVLASDWDSLYHDQSMTHIELNYATHPEPSADGLMKPYYFFNQDYTTETNTSTVLKLTGSYWIWPADIMRGPIDTNYGFDDGSVARFNTVTGNEGGPTTPGSNRFAWLPQSDTDNQKTWKFRMPAR